VGHLGRRPARARLRGAAPGHGHLTLLAHRIGEVHAWLAERM